MEEEEDRDSEITDHLRWGKCRAPPTLRPYRDKCRPRLSREPSLGAHACGPPPPPSWGAEKLGGRRRALWFDGAGGDGGGAWMTGYWFAHGS